MLEKQEPESSSSEEAQAVTPWVASGFVSFVKAPDFMFSIASDDTVRLRRQFDLANREAMDESAEWRRMFDCEAEKASKCNSELALENAALLSKIETLKQELEASRLKCRSREAPH
ncbi:hypothetical protein Bca101_046959 [Brassica carinata]